MRGFPIGFGGVQRKPGDTAWGQFWFPGCTKAGLAEPGVCDQEVLYQLQIFGDFVDDSPVFPLDLGDVAVMAMKDWILQISPGGLNLQMASCLAESEDGTVFRQFLLDEVVIRVTRTK